MTVDLLARLGATDIGDVQDQIRAAHAELPKESCMAWRHKRLHPLKEGGCDVHREEQ